MLRRSLILVVALAALSIALVAAQSSSARSAAFPITIHAANGDVVIKARPTRIVSLSPTATEDLFAVGAGAQVIAVDDQSDYPKRAPRTKLSGFTPNVEAIASYNPDLVVVSNDGGLVALAREARHHRAPRAGRGQRRAGVRPDPPARPRDRPRRRRRRSVVRSMQKSLTSLIRSVPKKSRHLKVYHELDPTYYSATSATFIGRIYRLFGFRNIADAADSTHSGYPQLSARVHRRLEPRHRRARRLDLLRPDRRDASRAARAGAGSPPCSKRRVVAIDDSVASRWGPRIVDFARAVAAVAKRS